MEPNHYIYITTNKLNGKKYVGRCSSRSAWNNGYLGSGKWLKLSIEKYGKENFERLTLEEIYGDIKEAIIAEEKWILYYDAKNRKDFYNLSENCGGFDKGDTHSDSTKNLISERTRKAMKAMGREYYANRNNSGSGRSPWNKGKKFSKDSDEYKKRYTNRKKPRPRHKSQEDADRTKIEWEAWLASGENSGKKFCEYHNCSYPQLKKYLSNNFIFIKNSKEGALSQKAQK